MEHRTRLQVDAEPDLVLSVLADLSTYPEWNDVVATAVAETMSAAGDPAWSITLRARVGPLARSKQLRMVRTHDRDGSIRFERRELDDRQHAPWTMEAAVAPAGAGSTTIDLVLRYDGGLWSTPLDAVLGAAIERSHARLPDYLTRR